MGHNELWKILKEMGIPDTLPASWEICMQVKKQQLELDMEQWTGSNTGKGVGQWCILSPYLFNLFAEYIMQNAGLDEAQSRIKIAMKNIKLLGKITSDMQMTPPLWQKVKRN